MANPDDILAQQRETVASLDRQLEELSLRAEKERAVLRGMEMYAEAVGNGVKRVMKTPRSFSDLTEKRVGGRQPGSISRRWRVILTSLLTAFEWFDADDVISAVKSHEGRDMKPSEVKRLFEGYVKHGFLDQNDDGDYRVTDAAIRKFGLEPKQPPATDVPDENEASNGDATDASEAHDRGVEATPFVSSNPQSWHRA